MTSLPLGFAISKQALAGAIGFQDPFQPLGRGPSLRPLLIKKRLFSKQGQECVQP